MQETKQSEIVLVLQELQRVDDSRAVGQPSQGEGLEGLEGKLLCGSRLPEPRAGCLPPLTMLSTM